ncbi:Sensory transduction protein LytR [termite gut metagenome]|uniref:Sensory transduction protein LytR n=1 Tax=termite gut metagenome TaxID=433724 RepID=A0A5J4Q282_9ZZZZ
MNVLIVEDETAAYKNLKAVVTEIEPSIKLVGYTESIVQTVRWMTNNPAPDLIFMDIHLSDGSAFNIFTAIIIEIPVIFTTAYDEYAIDAFKVNSIDYLLKPIGFDETKRAIEKFQRLQNQDAFSYLSKLPQLVSTEKYPQKMLIPVNNELIPVNVNQVSYFYTTACCTRTVLKDNSSYCYIRALDNIYASLDPNLFFRANKQFVISKDSIKNITIWFDSRLLVTLDTEVPERIFISKNKAALFKKWFTY